MKLLIDENLAPQLATLLSDLFPGSVHVSAVDLGSTPDARIWQYARENGFTFVTKDKDFANLSLVWGAPPKVILLQLGNCTTKAIESAIRSNAVRITDFETNVKRSVLVLKSA